jgi:hypothetical protein
MAKPRKLFLQGRIASCTLQHPAHIEAHPHNTPTRLGRWVSNVKVWSSIPPFVALWG